ncbi:hypothetical protein S245_060803, partial [Arachis hypogaea]
SPFRIPSSKSNRQPRNPLLPHGIQVQRGKMRWILLCARARTTSRPCRLTRSDIIAAVIINHIRLDVIVLCITQQSVPNPKR